MARFMWGAARGSNRRLRSEDASTSTTSVNSIPYAIRVRDHPQSSTVSIAREKSSGVRARAHPRTGLRPLGTSASKRRGTVCHLRLQTSFHPTSSLDHARKSSGVVATIVSRWSRSPTRPGGPLITSS